MEVKTEEDSLKTRFVAACEAITIREATGSIDIGHRELGGTIHVYRPERDRFGDGTVIKPGWINASSWSAGTGRRDMTVEDVHIEMMIRLRMMDIALDRLNAYNSVLLDWTDISSPFEDAAYKPRYIELQKQHREAKEAAADAANKKQGRKKK
jgi:hypothetical protein